MTRPNSTHPAWWQRLRHRERPPPHPDPADMGTCFGLEASFGEQVAAPARGAAAAPRSPGWLARLGNRVKPAG